MRRTPHWARRCTRKSLTVAAIARPPTAMGAAWATGSSAAAATRPQLYLWKYLRDQFTTVARAGGFASPAGGARPRARTAFAPPGRAMARDVHADRSRAPDGAGLLATIRVAAPAG